MVFQYGQIQEVAARAPMDSRSLAVRSVAQGPQVKRKHSPAGAYSDTTHWAYTEAKRLYGPHNPLAISDRTYAIMELDWTIGLALEIWRTAFSTVDYWLEGPSKEITSFCERVWDLHYRQWISAMLTALPWGRSTSEIKWGLQDVRFSFQSQRQENTTVDRLRRQAFVISELRNLRPTDLTLLSDVKSGDYAGIRMNEGDVFLPPEATVHVVNDRRFGELRGRALSHRSYSPWWWNNWRYLALNNYLEKKGDPPLTGYAPTEETTDADGNTHDPVNTLAVAAANIRMGSNFIMPGEMDPETRQRLYELREMQVAARAEEFLPAIQNGEAMKALGTLTSPELLSIGGKTFASSKTARRQQFNLFTDRQQELILDPANRWILPKLVRANFPNARDSDIPRVRAGNMSENALEVMADLIKSNQKVASITKDRRPVPVGSRIDYSAAMRAMGVPLIDEDSIPDGLEVGNERPMAGRPEVAQRNPDRPEGPDERGFDRTTPYEIMRLDRAEPEDLTAKSWWKASESTLTEIDTVVNKSEEAIDRAKRRANRRARAVIKRFVREATTTETKDGVKILSTRNRSAAGKLRSELEAIFREELWDKIMDEREIESDAFARGMKPLSRAHVKAASAARDHLDASALPAPSARRTARLARDITRDSKSNALAVPTAEARRVAEIFDRLVQSGEKVIAAEDWADAWEISGHEGRDLRASTVAHVRATARATFSATPILESSDVGGWVVMVSPPVEARILADYPKGKVADLAFRTFESASDLDSHFRNLSQTEGIIPTSWRNLGRTFFSEEYYLPVHTALWPAVLTLAQDKRMKWLERRRAAQQRLEERAGL